MAARKRINITLKWMASVLSLAAGAYAGYVGVTWLRYGRPAHARSKDLDPLLDRFMPVYDIVERHDIRVAAPADVTFSAACEIDMQQSPIIRAIFRAREAILGSEPDTTARPRGLLAWSKSLGWGVLAETPDREIVMGAVTQPWKANVLFRPLSARRVHDVQRARLREDRVDAPRGRDRRDRIGLPNRDPGSRDRRDGADQVPTLLVATVARDHRDSQDDASAAQSRSRTPC